MGKKHLLGLHFQEDITFSLANLHIKKFLYTEMSNKQSIKYDSPVKVNVNLN